MVPLSREFRTAWDSLEAATEKSGWRTIPVGFAGKVEIHAGRRFPENEESLLVRFPAHRAGAGERFPDAQGFAVEQVDPGRDGGTWFAVTRKQGASVEFFVTMVTDIAECLVSGAGKEIDARGPMQLFLGRVRAWQEFMRGASRALGAEAEIGLAGELCVLADLLGAGFPASLALAGWAGPDDGLQDFLVGTGAVEVKTTLASSGFPARIASLEQLDDTVRQPLYLAAVRLRQIAGGRTLPEIAAGVRALVAEDASAARVLAEKLAAADFFESQASHYVRRFETAAIRYLRVDDTFPRLKRIGLPRPVLRATYEIDVDAVPGAGVSAVSLLIDLGVK